MVAWGDSSDELTRRVIAAGVGDRINLSDIHPSLKEVWFNLDGDGQYSWIAKDQVGYILHYPRRSTWNILSFRTLDGAKRNFLNKWAR